MNIAAIHNLPDNKTELAEALADALGVSLYKKTRGQPLKLYGGTESRAISRLNLDMT